MGEAGAGKARDFWDKLEVVLHPVGGLLTALSVAGVGFFGSQMLDRRQAADTNARLYSEIMSRREESETALRKDMLVSVVQSYLQPKAEELGTRVLNIELLAYNFHDSINLKPLFLDLSRQIRSSVDPRSREYGERLKRVAREIASKEVFALQAHGDTFTRSVEFADLLAKKAGSVALDPETITVDGVDSDIKLRVIGVNEVNETLRVRLEVAAHRAGAEPLVTSTAFDVGFYDFPMIDNSRLANGQRCAVTMTNLSMKAAVADLAVVCFPGEYASLKDRPYYDEVLRRLQDLSQNEN